MPKVNLYDKKQPERKRICGPSEEYCRNKLYEQYGTRYEVLDKKKKLRGGFMGMFQRTEMEI